MRHPIVRAHQEALSALEDVRHEVRCCAMDNTTKCEKPCPCDIYQRMLYQEQVVEEKSEVLREYNQKIIAQNEIREAQQSKIREEKQRKREERIERNRRQEEQRKQRILEEKLLIQQSKPKEVQVVAKSLKGQPLYELTVELYNQHKNDGMKDNEIREKYEIKSTSRWNQWKTENGLVRTYSTPKTREVAQSHERTKTVVYSEYERVVKELELLQKQHEELLKTPANTSEDAELERKALSDKLFDSELRYKEMKQQYDALVEKFNHQAKALQSESEMCETYSNAIKLLEFKLAEYKENAPTSDVSEDDQIDYKKNYEAMRDSATHFESLYNDTALAYEQLQREVDAMMTSQVEKTESLSERLESQVRQWDKYENILHGRIKVLKQENKHQRKYIKQLEGNHKI